jgi:hypothetical protein
MAYVERGLGEMRTHLTDLADSLMFAEAAH